MTKECRLTTVDNPFDPFEDFTSWYLFDMEKGYDCCGRVDRLANYSDDMTENEIEMENGGGDTAKINVDGKEISGNVVPAFSDGKTHAVKVVM